MSENPSFRPATPWGWVIWAVRYLRLDLAWRNRLHLEPRDLRCCGVSPRGRASSSSPTTPMRRTSRPAWNSPPLRPPVPLHDEPRGVRRGLRDRRLVAPAPRRFLRGTRRSERGGETLRRRGGEAGTGGARHLPGRGDLLPERPGAAVQERRRRDRDAGRGRGAADPAGLDGIPGPDGHQVPLPPAHRSPPGAADPPDGAAVSSGASAATRSPEDWASSWRTSCIARR